MVHTRPARIQLRRNLQGNGPEVVIAQRRITITVRHPLAGANTEFIAAVDRRIEAKVIFAASEGLLPCVGRLLSSQRSRHPWLSRHSRRNRVLILPAPAQKRNT